MKVLKPVELILHQAVAVKNYLYDKELLSSYGLPCPVISVGNVSFGGTGKTPCILMLLELLSFKYKINVICKSYKGDLQTAEKVDLKKHNAAAYFGDEACLIQKKFPQVHVWSGPNKYETALASLKDQPQLILVDDGFSHRKLKRNFDLVLIDSDLGFSDYLRESKASLVRAQAVVLTKASSANQVKRQHLKEEILKINNKLEDCIYEAEAVLEIPASHSQPILLFSAIAKPDFLEKSLKDSGYNLIEHLRYSDHHQYTADDLTRIFKKYEELKVKNNNTQLLATEKDLVKISKGKVAELAKAVSYKMNILDHKEGDLIEKISRFF